jgi:putative ABC transport system permease protein
MIRNYLTLAWKVLLRRKFFTFISLFGISFTLVVLVLVTAMLDHVVGQYPPETRQDRTVGIYFASLSSEHWRRNGFAGFALLDKEARNLPNVEALGIASMPGEVFSYLNGQRIQSYLKRTDGVYWQILDFHFLEGGPFTTDDVKNGRMMAVINETTRSRFFGRSTALGRTLEADGQRFTVVGVVPDVPILRLVPFADIWVPYTTAKSDSYKREWVGDFMGLLLLKDPAQLKLTRDELWSRLKTVQVDEPGGKTTLAATPETLFDTIGRMFTGDGTGGGFGYGRRLQLFLALGAALFMLLPAVNLMNLNTSRIMERASEIGVRKAFGASSLTLVAQFVIENVFLTLVGAVVGFLLAALVLRIINASGLILYAQLHLNYRIFGWGVVMAVAFGLLSGVYPAWRMSRLHPVQALKGAAR